MSRGSKYFHVFGKFKLIEYGLDFFISLNVSDKFVLARVRRPATISKKFTFQIFTNFGSVGGDLKKYWLLTLFFSI